MINIINNMISKALQILELKPGNRTEDEIKKKYKQLAKKFHPDRIKNKELKEQYTKKFQEIHQAYKLLTTNEKIDNIKPPEIQSVLPITLEELYIGIIKTIIVSCQIICYKCPEHKNCENCSGNGYLITWNNIHCICFKCGGTGRIILDCEYCHGRKVYMINKELEININNQKQNIIVKNQGHEFFGNLNAGDINIILDIQPHSDYELLSNGKLLRNITIDLDVALLGKQLILKHLDNTELIINIPECTQIGQVLEIPYLGFNRDNLLIKIININLPTKLIEEDKKLLSKITFNY